MMQAINLLLNFIANSTRELSEPFDIACQPLSNAFFKFLYFQVSPVRQMQVRHVYRVKLVESHLNYLTRRLGHSLLETLRTF